MGELAALATAFCWTFTSIFFFIGGKAVGTVYLNRMRLALAVLFLIISHLIVFGSPFPYSIEPERMAWLVLSGIIGLILGDSCLYKSIMAVGPRLATLMMATTPVIGSITAWLFLNETLTWLEVFAIALTVTGIGWVVLDRHIGSGTTTKKQYFIGILYGFGGAMGQALGLITAKKGLVDNYSPLSGVLIRMVAALVFMWGIAIFRGSFKSTIMSFKNRKAAIAITGGAFLGPFLGVWFSLIAIDMTRIGIAATLMAMTPILILPIAKWGLKETITVRAVFGTIIALTGVSLIFLF